MKHNFNKFEFFFYQENERAKLSVQTWKFSYIENIVLRIWVCILIVNLINIFMFIYFFTCNETSGAYSYNNIFLYREFTNAIFFLWSYLNVSMSLLPETLLRLLIPINLSL
jgi:hypothetical protein